MDFLQALLTVTLFGSSFWGISLLLLFFVGCFWADFEEQGFLATLFLLIIGLLFYFVGKDTWIPIVNMMTWKFFAVYFVAGLVHSFIRVFFYGRKQMNKLNEYRLRHSEIFDYEPDIDRDVKSHVFRWWFMWPISLISWFVKDMIKEIYYWVYQKFTKVFDFVLDIGIKSIKEVPKKEKK